MTRISVETLDYKINDGHISGQISRSEKMIQFNNPSTLQIANQTAADTYSPRKKGMSTVDCLATPRKPNVRRHKNRYIQTA